MGQGETWKNGAIGALAAFVAQLLPIVGIVAPFVGGGIAGYLQRQSASSGAKAGLASGIVLLIPNVLVAGLLFVGLTLLGGVAGSLETLVGGMAVGLVGGVGLVVVVGGYLLFAGLVGGLIGGALGAPSSG